LIFEKSFKVDTVGYTSDRPGEGEKCVEGAEEGLGWIYSDDIEAVWESFTESELA
jgi:hypothetical protein